MAENAHHHHGTPATGFHRMLKEGTQALHDQAESGDFQVRMVNGELTRLEFVAFLGQMRHVHAAFDPAIQHAAASDERVARLFDESHLRLHRIDQDLADLDSKSVADPLPSTQKFVDYIGRRLEDQPTSLIGVLYVKEGATNGNKIVSKRLQQAMELESDQAMRYMDPHGKDQRRNWNAFKTTLNELDLSEQEQADCVQVAQETFQMVMDVSREIPVAEATTA